jgi:cell surface protein SprA
MRMFMTGSSNSSFWRSFRFIRGEWRRYTSTLDFNDINVADDGTELDVSRKYSGKQSKMPINYITPPGVRRDNCLITIPLSTKRAIIVVTVSGEGLELEIQEQFSKM